MQNNDKQLFSGIVFLCALIPFSLLIVAKSLLFPFITGKALYFRILIELAAVLMGYLLLKYKELRPQKNEYVFWAMLLFILSIFALLPFSVRPYVSFWGNAERMEGVWSLLHLSAWFLVLYLLFRIKPESKKTIFYAFLFVTAIIGIQEIYEGAALHIFRPSATLGNATYIGFISLLMIFLCLFFMSDIKKKTGKIWIYVLLALFIAAMLTSGSRGPILALIIGLLCTMLYGIVIAKRSLKTRIIYLFFVVVLLAGFYGFLKTDLALSVPGIDRLAGTLQGTQNVDARLMAWQIFMEGFRAKPLTGYGLENAPIAYFTFFNPKIFNFEEVIFDRPHNKFIEILVTQGLIGFFIWALFILCVFWAIKGVKENWKKISLIGMTVAYLVQNASLFDMQASYLLFFFGVALTAPTISIERQNRKAERQTYVSPLATSLLTIALIYGWYISFSHLYLVRTVIARAQLSFSEGLPAYTQLMEKAGPFKQEVSIIFNSYTQAHAKEVNSQDQLNIMIDVFRKAYAQDPYDMRIFNFYVGQMTNAISAKSANNMDTSKERAEIIKVFNEMTARFPKFPDLYLNRATFEGLVGDKKHALKILLDAESTMLFSPRHVYYLAGLYDTLGEEKLALAAIKKGEANNISPNSIDAGLVALSVYIQNKDIIGTQRSIGSIGTEDQSDDTLAKVNEVLLRYNVPKISRQDLYLAGIFTYLNEKKDDRAYELIQKLQEFDESETTKQKINSVLLQFNKQAIQ